MSYVGLPYVAFSLACVVFLRMVAGGWFFLLFTFCCVWIGDTAAYYAGRAFGRYKFSPADQPEEDLGGRNRLGSGQHRSLALCWCISRPRSTDGLFSVRPVDDARGLHRKRPSGCLAYRPRHQCAAQLGDLFESHDQAWRGDQGLRYLASRAWRRARPN